MDFVTAKELASMFFMSVATLYRHLDRGPVKPGQLDLRKLRSSYVGKKRLWHRKQVEQMWCKQFIQRRG